MTLPELCQQSIEEIVMHLLFHCPFAKDCWGALNFLFNDQLSISQICHEWKVVTPLGFAMDIFILSEFG